MCYATERDVMEKTAVVAGASGGIGRACALELHKRGYACVLNGRREEPLKELSGAIGGGGNSMHVVTRATTLTQFAISVLFSNPV